MLQRGEMILRIRVGSFFLSLFSLKILASFRLSIRTNVLKSCSRFPGSVMVERIKESASQQAAMQCLKHSHFP
jgi:hypothetical protein